MCIRDRSTPVINKAKELSMNDIFNLIQTMSENMVKNSDLSKRLDATDEKLESF